MVDPVKRLKDFLPEALADYDDAGPPKEWEEIWLPPEERGNAIETGLDEELHWPDENDWGNEPWHDLPDDEHNEDDFPEPVWDEPHGNGTEPLDDDESPAGRPVTVRNCAWYQPFHHYPTTWGIYIRNSCLLSMAKRYIPTARRLAAQLKKEHSSLTNPPALSGRAKQVLNSVNWAKMFAYQLSLIFYYYHEAYHHRADCLGARIELLTRAPFYIPQIHDLHRVRLATNSDNTSPCLEEALAEAHALRSSTSFRNRPWRELREAFPNRPEYQELISSFRDQIRSRLVAQVASGLPHYRLGADIFDGTYRYPVGGGGTSALLDMRKATRWWQEECLIHSTSTSTPTRARVQDWELGSHLTTGYANFRTRFTKAGSHFWRVV